MKRIPYLFEIVTIYLMSRGTSFSEIHRSKYNMVSFSVAKRGILYIINKCVPMPWEMWSEADLKHFNHQKNIFWGSTKSIWGQKVQFLRAMS